VVNLLLVYVGKLLRRFLGKECVSPVLFAALLQIDDQAFKAHRNLHLLYYLFKEVKNDVQSQVRDYFRGNIIRIDS